MYLVMSFFISAIEISTFRHSTFEISTKNVVPAE
jgi:hypothetical protein